MASHQELFVQDYVVFTQNINVSISSKININGSNDTFYRYKMPPLICHVKTSGMAKTTFINIQNVSKSLKVKPQMIINYFSQQLNVKADQKKWFISGNNHTKDNINKVFTSFIRQFILCSKCELP